MSPKLAASIWVLITLMALATAHPSCGSQYGRPSADDCSWILNTNMHRNKNSRETSHCFAPATLLERPDDVPYQPWLHKVLIAKFWSFGNCRVALFPLINASDGSLSYDLSRYPTIVSHGHAIVHYCIEGGGNPAVVDYHSGGMEVTGDNERLRLILYAPKSTFENDTVQDFKKSKPYAIQEDTDDEYQPEGPSRSPPRTRRRTSGGMGLMSSVGVRTRTCNLGEGWYMNYDSTTSIMPTAIGAAKLEAFYDQLFNSAADQISSIVNATNSLAVDLGGFHLRLSSTVAISWTWVMNFAAEMLDHVSNDFATLFSGEAISGYWDLPAVQASLTAG